MVPLGGVVVDDVQQHLDACRMERANHPLEVADLPASVARAAVLVVRGEVGDRVVAPVVAQPLREQPVVLHELVHGQQLHGGDAEAQEVLDHDRVREAGVRPPQVRIDVRVQLRQPLDVRLVDDGLVEWRTGRLVVAPGEGRVHDDAPGHERPAVGRVHLVGCVRPMPEHRRLPAHVTLDGLRVRIDQELRRIAALPVRGVPRAVHAVAVPLSRHDRGQVAVPDEAGRLREVHAHLVVVVVEEAQLDPFGDLGEHGERRSLTVERGAERVRIARPHVHAGVSRAAAEPGPQRCAEGRGAFPRHARVPAMDTGRPAWAPGCALTRRAFCGWSDRQRSQWPRSPR